MRKARGFGKHNGVVEITLDKYSKDPKVRVVYGEAHYSFDLDDAQDLGTKILQLIYDYREGK